MPTIDDASESIVVGTIVRSGETPNHNTPEQIFTTIGSIYRQQDTIPGVYDPSTLGCVYTTPDNVPPQNKSCKHVVTKEGEGFGSFEVHCLRGLSYDNKYIFSIYIVLNGIPRAILIKNKPPGTYVVIADDLTGVNFKNGKNSCYCDIKESGGVEVTFQGEGKSKHSFDLTFPDDNQDHSKVLNEKEWEDFYNTVDNVFKKLRRQTTQPQSTLSNMISSFRALPIASQLFSCIRGAPTGVPDRMSSRDSSVTRA